jgi:parvulin-like peptidyl-prolyl isomerase
MLSMSSKLWPKSIRIVAVVVITISLFVISACAAVLGSRVTPTPILPSATVAPPTPTPPPLAAKVNGQFITLAEFEAELERYQDAQTELGRSVPPDEAKQIVLDDMIASELLSQGAHEAGYVCSDAELESRKQKLTNEPGDEAALSEWITEHGYSDESLSVALRRAVEAAWMRDKIIADVPSTAEQVHVRQILTYNADEANAIKGQLDGGEDFNQLAAIYDPVARGELGWVPPGYLLDKNADETVFGTPLGSYSSIVETKAGYHIFFVVERGVRPLSPDALLALQASTLLSWLDEKRVKSDIVQFP